MGGRRCRVDASYWFRLEVDFSFETTSEQRPPQKRHHSVDGSARLYIGGLKGVLDFALGGRREDEEEVLRFLAEGRIRAAQCRDEAEEAEWLEEKRRQRPAERKTLSMVDQLMAHIEKPEPGRGRQEHEADDPRDGDDRGDGSSRILDKPKDSAEGQPHKESGDGAEAALAKSPSSAETRKRWGGLRDGFWRSMAVEEPDQPPPETSLTGKERWTGIKKGLQQSFKQPTATGAVAAKARWGSMQKGFLADVLLDP